MNQKSNIFETIQSDFLANLREIEWLKKLVGPLAQFKVIVDANIILADLKWLVGGRKNPEASTDLMECMRAHTLLAYAPQSVFDEVEKRISDVAAKFGLSEDSMREEWSSYKILINVVNPSEVSRDIGN